MDLSNNRLSGHIPTSISSLDFLSRLDLSVNKLSGHVQSSNQLSTPDDRSIYRGNDGLCGAPRLKVCPGDEHDDADGRDGRNSSEGESNEVDSIVN
ncbi:Pectinesterase [Psidium guajava]|nr:Pectinesterase [Psidium guajava]